MPRRRLWEAVVEPGGVPPDGRVEAVLVARRQEPAEGGERGALQRPGVVVAGAVEAPVRLVLACHLLPQRLTRGLPRLCV